MQKKERLSLTSYLLEIPAFPWTRTFPEKQEIVILIERYLIQQLKYIETMYHTTINLFLNILCILYIQLGYLLIFKSLNLFILTVWRLQ